MGLALFTEATGTLSVGWRCRAPSPLGEDTGRLPNWVLEAWAKKWTHRASVLQGVSLKKEEREKERERKIQRPELWWSGICSFIFKRNFYTLSYTFLKVKDTESAQHSINFTLIETRTFSVHLFINKGLMLCLALWPVNILWLFSDKGWKQENLFSLKVFFLYFSQPQKVLIMLHSHGAEVQWVTTKKELISSKVWCG